LIFNILLLFTIFSAFGFDKDFKLEDDRAPLEFVMMFDSLKLELKTPKEKAMMAGICQELGENLGSLEKEHIFLLMKSQVIKDVLEYKFSKVRQFDVTIFLLERLEKNFLDKERFLNPFSQWIWKSVIAELNNRKNLGMISNKSFSPNSFDGPKRQEALRFERYLSYLLPWIDRMDSLTAPQFNELTKEVSWNILRHLNERSLLFKRYAPSSSGEGKTSLFNIPQRLLNLSPQKFKDDTPEEKTLKEQSELEKTQARDQMERISPDDMSPLSDDLGKDIEQIR
jgi:hypothetical protein